MKRILYTIIFLWVAVTYTHAQQHCFFTHYSTEDGLSQNTVMSILQDHKDNLWFATWDGINRFDGYTFKVYKARQGNYISLANNRVDRLYEDCNGFLWLMTYDNRVHRFDPRTETFEQVPKAGDKGSYLNIHRVEVLANGTVWLFTENDGAIRVTISEQGSRFSCDIYSAESGLFPALYVNRVYLDKAGNEWLLTDNGLGMIPAGEKRAISYFVDTSEKAKGLKQAFYA
ncbi:ligand-binding sensor domain-containing protein [Bacteroides reticulotermitis]|uniref:DNA-binding response regulator n=3 Tax=Bacteroides reticulotermitis TaxID=1133319 RepID=W4URQ8_9BACE|nr:DNA-binding response regulator [Bacteroides reticulotermitis JCM 10512]